MLSLSSVDETTMISRRILRSYNLRGCPLKRKNAISKGQSPQCPEHENNEDVMYVVVVRKGKNSWES